MAAVAAPLLADKPRTRIEIEVTDHEGEPVERATVVVKFVEGRSIKKFGGKKSTKWQLKTNQSGIAKLPTMPQGELMVQVIAENYQTFGAVFEVLEEEKTLQIQLNPPQPQFSVH